MSTNNKMPSFSYSRLGSYDKCPWEYKLKYQDKHYVPVESMAIDLGVLVHKIEERIAISIMDKHSIDYAQFQDDFENYNIPKSSAMDREGGIYGINILKNKYRSEFYAIDQTTGTSYFEKCENYKEQGIHRQEQFLLEHPELELYAVEKYFEFMFDEKHKFSGYIDRIYKYKEENKYIIDDIKTKGKPFDHKDLTTPLQHVIYNMALQRITGAAPEDITCFYDLPLLGIRQEAGTKGFLKRGEKKIQKIFEGIEAGDWTPCPSALCYWCPYSGTNPNIRPEEKGLCCWYSLWRKDTDTPVYEKFKEWPGIEQADAVLAKANQEREEQEAQMSPEERTKQQRQQQGIIDFGFKF